MTNATTTERAPNPGAPALRWSLRLASLAWAGFWSWFVVLDGLHDARELGPGTYGVVLAFLAALWIPTALAWRRPLAGALGMGIVGLGAFVLLAGAFARAWFAGPPLALALALAWLGARARAPRAP